MNGLSDTSLIIRYKCKVSIKNQSLSYFYELK